MATFCGFPDQEHDDVIDATPYTMSLMPAPTRWRRFVGWCRSLLRRVRQLLRGEIA